MRDENAPAEQKVFCVFFMEATILFMYTNVRGGRGEDVEGLRRGDDGGRKGSLQMKEKLRGL